MDIKGFSPRLYQETIFSSCSQKNSLIVLPTGMGKTNIFLMLAAHRMTLYPNKKILLLGPTRPLIEQYKKVFTKFLNLPPEETAIFTGQVAPAKRAELWKTSKVIFSTPQGVENDIVNRRIDLSQVSLLGIDESHRAVGDYAYVFVARQYQKNAEFPLIAAMTASPGSDMAKIEEVCENLFVENIEVRTNEDPDVKPYIKDVKVTWVPVKLTPELKKIQSRIKEMLKQRMERLKGWGILRRKDTNYVSRTDIISLQAELRGRAANGEKDFTLWTAISVLAEVMKIFHGLELLESQGIIPLHTYLNGIYKDSFKTKTKATQNIAKDPKFREIILMLEALIDDEIFHPKMDALIKIVKKEIQEKDTKLLIFNQFRDNVVDIERQLSSIEGARPSIFVGQMKKNGTGLSQKEQKALIEQFNDGTYNIVISTSIGEEGLDIPKVDTVIFYEPVPSAIRSIQRRGRTGRLDKGKVVILMAEGTRDEAYKWSSHHKELRMYRNLDTLKKKLTVKSPSVTLSRYQEPVEKIKILVDHREKANHVVKELIDLGADVELRALEVGDYLLSKRVGIEYKKVEDFVNSILDGRLLSQLKELKRNIERPILLIEGEEDIYSVRNIHPNAIRGIISTITVSYGIPMLTTRNSKETAALFKVIARREQETSKDFEMHFEKKKSDPDEQMEYIISSIPGIGITTAKTLLKKFKTVKKIVNAKEDSLQKVDKVGKKTATSIRTLLDNEYTR